MVIQNEAIRKYHKGKLDDTQIDVHIPVDNKSSKYTTELFKRVLFFVQVGFILPLIENEPDLLENMIKYYQIFQESLNSNTCCHIFYFYSNFLDESGKFTLPLSKYDCNSFFAFHIGLVGVGLEDVQFRFYQAVTNNRYNPRLYGYHNKEIFFYAFMLRTPYNYADEYLNIMKDISLKYYD